MKDDLISRKTVRDGLMKYGFHAPDMTVHEFVEDELPSAPAVPLDKVCAILEETYETPPCWKCEKALGEEYCQEKECGCGSKEHWKAYFEKLMEGIG